MRISSHLIRENNVKVVLRQIMNHEPLSRADISQNTRLNKSSVSEIVKKLIDADIVRELGIGKSTEAGGRKPILLEFNEKAGVSLAIDLGIHTIRTQYTDLKGNVLKQKTYHTNQYYDTVKKILDESKSVGEDYPFSIVGVCISIQGIVDKNNIIFTPYYNVVDIENLLDAYSFPISLLNEANATNFAHYYFNDDHAQTIATITLGSGIGSGIIFEDQIYLGEMGSAGELGHSIVVPQGRTCPCGNKGCLEQYSSELAILTQYQKAMNDNKLTLDDFLKASNNEDEVAINLLNEMGEYLSVGINNYIALYAPKVLYLSGETFKASPKIIDMIKNNIQKSIFTKMTQIELSKYDLLDGANMYAIQKFIDTYR